MGREIRRVPPNWEHPKDERGNYKALYDQDFNSAAREWLDGCIAWENGTHEDLIKDPELKKKYPYYWQLNDDPPDEEYYRPAFTEEPTWYQVYETVSEGTPVTPPFATKEELINYLVEYGDFWDQKRGHGGYAYDAAESFVNSGWAPSFVVLGNKFMSGIEAAGEIKNKKEN
jgi:hypothetical protein